MGLPLTYKVKFDEMEWVEVGDGMRFKRFQQGDLQVRLVEWDKAMVHPAWCLKGHIGYVVDGVVEIDVAGTVHLFETGDVFILPDGEEHRHRPKVLSESVRFFAVEKVS